MCQDLYWDRTSCNSRGIGFSVTTEACGTLFNNGAGAPYYYTSSAVAFKVAFAFKGFPLAESHGFELRVDRYGNGQYYYY
ncbi:MAG: hypothetical protein MSC31_02245 [Solirubrobacteraceae bacterium MAG38_C4-C5]|nr:hypothetical protein [Candidatus Siliceabacter maunaloa]